jgi:hypothetical protein
MKGVLLIKRVEEENNLDVFEMIISINEITTKLVNMKLLIFKHYQVDVKNIKCPLQWWEKHESMFSIVGFCVRQILGIVGSEIERIFLFDRIFISYI